MSVIYSLLSGTSGISKVLDIRMAVKRKSPSNSSVVHTRKAETCAITSWGKSVGGVELIKLP